MFETLLTGDCSTNARARALIAVGDASSAWRAAADQRFRGLAADTRALLLGANRDRSSLVSDDLHLSEREEFWLAAERGFAGGITPKPPARDDLAAVSVALQCGNPERATAAWDRFFDGFGLRGPSIRSRSVTNEIGINAFDGVSGAPPRLRSRRHRNPLVSVIMTVHNEQNYVRAALQSLIEQTWDHLEIIVVDDASTDATGTIVSAMAEADQRIMAVRREERVGTFAAKNVGLAIARGEFLTMHDGDDWSHPSKIERSVGALLRSPRLQAVSSHLVRIAADTGMPTSRAIGRHVRWNPSSLLYRRSVFETLGGYRQNLLGADCEFAARIETAFGARAHSRMPAVLSLCTARPGSLSQNYRSDGTAIHRVRDWERWRRDHVAALRAPKGGVLKRGDPTLARRLRTSALPSPPSNEPAVPPASTTALPADLPHAAMQFYAAFHGAQSRMRSARIAQMRNTPQFRIAQIALDLFRNPLTGLYRLPPRAFTLLKQYRRRRVRNFR